MKKEIIKFIENKFSFPYLYYDKVEQTWYNEFFLYDIKTETIFVSDVPVSFKTDKRLCLSRQQLQVKTRNERTFYFLILND